MGVSNPRVGRRRAEPSIAPVAAAPAGDAASAPASAAKPANAEALIFAIDAGLDLADTRGLPPVDRAFIAHVRRSLVTAHLRLPPMPEAAVRIDRVVRRANCTVHEVAAAIAADPALATKVIGIANSPCYGGLARIRRLDGAITRLGLRETKAAVQAMALGSGLMRVPGYEAQVDRLYHHALATAAAARAIAVAVRADDDVAFLAGLIHDLGRSIFLSALGDFERANGRKVAPTPATVKALSDALHEDLSALVAVSWHVGADIECAVRLHEAPERAPPGEGGRLTQILALGDDLARFILDPARRSAPVGESVRTWLAEALGIVRLDAVIAKVEAAAELLGLSLARPPVRDEAISPGRTAHLD